MKENSKWKVLSILAMAAFIMVIDSTAMNVSISYLVKDLKTDIGAIQTIMATYTLIMAVCMLPGARIADIFGKTKVFIFGVFLYGVGTLTAAVAQNTTMLFIGWALIEGIAAALMMPTAMSLITSAYQGKDRVIAMSIYTAMSSVALAIGPIFGGVITTYLSWRFVFALEVLIIIYILVNLKTIKSVKCPPADKNAKFDFIGSGLSAVALFCIIQGALQSQAYGWFTSIKDLTFLGITIPKGGLSITTILIVTGIVFLGILIGWLNYAKKKGIQALVDVDIFKVRNFNVVLFINLCVQISLIGIMFVVPIYLQNILQYNALQTGLTLLPLSITLFITAMLVIKVTKFVKDKYIIFAGTMAIMLGGIYVYYAFSKGTTVTGLIVLPAMVCLGIGIGCSLSLTNNIALSSIDKKLSNQGSGMIATINNLGSSLSTAVIGSLLMSGINVGVSKVLITNYGEKFGAFTINEMLIKIAEATSRFKTSGLSQANFTPEQTAELNSIIIKGMNMSMQDIFIGVIVISIIGGVIALIGIKGYKNANYKKDAKNAQQQEMKIDL